MKNFTPAFAFILFLGFAPVASAESREGEIKAALDARTASFRTLLKDQSKGEQLVAELSENHPGCGEAVRSAFQAGGTLYSEKLDRAGVPLSSMQFPSGKQDDTFYHFTTSEEFMKGFASDHETLLGAGRYEEIFLFLRMRAPGKGRSYKSLWGRVFYIAEDASSISWWAPFGIEFHLKPTTRLFNWNETVWTEALAEIGAKHPAIADKCGITLDQTVADYFQTVHWNSLVFIAAEESGIELINHQAGHWYQLVSPNAFSGVKTLGKIGGGERYRYLPGRENEDLKKTTGTAPAELPAPPTISVIKAVFSGTDVTKLAGAFANGKAAVEYQVKGSRLGAVPAGQPVSFEIIWSCLRGGDPKQPVGKERTVRFASEAEGKTFKMACD